MKTADERAAEIVRVEEDALGMCRVLYDDDPQTDGTTRGFAEAVAAQMREPIVAAINAAVAAERERCAGVAEAGNGVAGGRDWLTARRLIAARIRGGE
jgi:hypothetical protein